ncbi:MAG: GNAT family N-acetyltransferase [Streptosporangiaceae bacterium]
MVAATPLVELSQREFLDELDVLLAIYADAMQAQASLLPGRLDLMRRHSSYPEFRAVHVRAGASGPVVGFAYGFRGQGGQWWYDAVWSVLARSAGARVAADWLADCMEIAEVHVRTEHQRAGIGSAMLMALTAGRTERTAVLSTPDRDTTARRLYRRVGFGDLLTGFSFPGGSPPYAVMGAVLPLRDPIAPDTGPSSASPSTW